MSDPNKNLDKFTLEEMKRLNFDPMRTILAALIATCFSAIIFLLSFTQDRNVLFDVSIFFLFLSLILLLDLFLDSVRIQSLIEGSKTPEEFFKARKKILGLAFFGINFFKFSLVFLTLFFSLYPIFFVFIIYLFYKVIRELKISISVLRDFNFDMKHKYKDISSSPFIQNFNKKLRFDLILNLSNLILMLLISSWLIYYYFLN